MLSDLFIFLRENANEIRGIARYNKIDAIQRLREMFYHDGSRNHLVPNRFQTSTQPTKLGLIEAKIAIEFITHEL